MQDIFEEYGTAFLSLIAAAISFAIFVGILSDLTVHFGNALNLYLGVGK